MRSSLLEPVAPTLQDSQRAAEAANRLSDGQLEVSELPDIALQLLSRILDELASGHALSVTPFETDMTTSEAAYYLNVSRPYLVKLLDEGKIPFHRIGTHRRVYFQDMKAYKKQQDEEAHLILAELQAEAQELHLGY